MTCTLSDPLLKGVVLGSRSTASRSGLIELSGANGQLVGDHTHGFVHLLKGFERQTLSVAPITFTVRETVKAFVEGLQQNKSFPITVEDGFRAVAIAGACYQSAANNGQATTVKEWLGKRSQLR